MVFLLPPLTMIRTALLLLSLVSTLRAGVTLDIEAFGKSLGGWNAKSKHACDYDLSGFKSLVDPADEGGKFEGLTLDEAGNIYLVSDDGDGPNQSYLVKLGYNGAVPEPATWAMMIIGFGLIGAAFVLALIYGWACGVGSRRGKQEASAAGDDA